MTMPRSEADQVRPEGAGTPTFGPRPVDRVARVIASSFIFTLVGPPIGGLTLLSWPVFTELVAKDIAGPSNLLGAIGMIAAVSYLVGFVPAAVAGLLIGLALATRGRLPWATILIVGIGVGVLSSAFLMAMLGRERSDAFASIAFYAILVCTVPTIVCSLIVRATERFWRATDAPRREGAT